MGRRKPGRKGGYLLSNLRKEFQFRNAVLPPLSHGFAVTAPLQGSLFSITYFPRI